MKYTTDKFIEICEKKHNGQYDYSNVEYVNNRTKVKIVHKECGNEFWQTPDKHMSGQGCPFCCKTKKKNKEEILQKFYDVHNDAFDYSKVDFVNMNTKVCIIHKDCGSEFWMTPKNHIKGQGCPNCKNKKISEKMTKPFETFVEEANKVHNFSYEYIEDTYKGSSKKVKIVCKKHGEFWQNANSHLNGCGCPKCGLESSAEKSRERYTSKFFKERSKIIHKGKYIYDENTIYTDARTPIQIICPIHGPFYQPPYRHLNGCGCPKCGGTGKLSTKEFIEKAKEIHLSEYDYSKVEYIDSHTKVCIICPEHGEFWMTPNAHLRGTGCPSCSHKISRSENEIFEYIKANTQLQVLNNVRGILSDNKELDIYIPSKKIAIEYNGMRWHSEEFGKDKNYHINKLNECNQQGIRLIQVFETEYIKNKDLILKKILHIIGETKVTQKVYARKCRVSEITKNEAELFLNKHHIQGFTSSTVYLGLIHDDKIVSVMSFKRQTNNSYKWELTRFSSDNSLLVIGGAGKLFAYFIEKYDPSEIKSFADRRWTVDENENLYTKLGFKLYRTTQPDYRYTKTQTDYIHKFRFRKEKLHKKYGFPMSMTESEMTSALGYYKIWDCGLFKFVYTKKVPNS